MAALPKPQTPPGPAEAPWQKQEKKGTLIPEAWGIACSPQGTAEQAREGGRTRTNVEGKNGPGNYIGRSLESTWGAGNHVGRIGNHVGGRTRNQGQKKRGPEITCGWTGNHVGAEQGGEKERTRNHVGQTHRPSWRWEATFGLPTDGLTLLGLLPLRPDLLPSAQMGKLRSGGSTHHYRQAGPSQSHPGSSLLEKHHPPPISLE